MYTIGCIVGTLLLTNNTPYGIICKNNISNIRKIWHYIENLEWIVVMIIKSRNKILKPITDIPFSYNLYDHIKPIPPNLRKRLCFTIKISSLWHFIWSVYFWKFFSLPLKLKQHIPWNHQIHKLSRILDWKSERNSKRDCQQFECDKINRQSPFLAVCACIKEISCIYNTSLSTVICNHLTR